MKTLLLSHGEPTKKMVGALRGEMANAFKLHQLMHENGYSVEPIVDIYALFQTLEAVESIAFLNCELAEHNHPILEKLPHLAYVAEKIKSKKPEFLFLLSWNYSLAALFGSGIQKSYPTASKLYVSHENENILAPLYEPSTLLLTEALLANQKGIEAGIPPWKMIHLPNHYPLSFENMRPHKGYLEKLIARTHKKVNYDQNTIVLGSIARLDYGKNIEYTLEVVKSLADQGANIIYILKGDFEEQTSYPIYRDWLKNLLSQLEEEPWLLWDQTPSPFTEIPDIYLACDLFLHLSGKEAGSNVIVEALSLGIPTIILAGSTNPSLFKNGAIFIDHDGTMPQDIVRPFRVPSKDDLRKKISYLIDNEKDRKNWSLQARSIAKQRFSPEIALGRLPLIYRAMKSYFANKDAEGVKQEVEKLYKEDLERYA